MAKSSLLADLIRPSNAPQSGHIFSAKNRGTAESAIYFFLWFSSKICSIAKKALRKKPSAPWIWTHELLYVLYERREL